MKEVGGYFGLEDFSGDEYYSGLTALNTGRNALAYLIRVRGITKIYIPKYLCDSIYRVCQREGCSYEFYEIGDDFQPLFNKIPGEDEWVYVTNYFGQVTNERALRSKYKRIILDNVQAFFQKPVQGIDTIYSCRKYFGVPDGAYLATNLKLILPEDISKDRMVHVLGRYEGTAAEYYDVFVDNEKALYDVPIKNMSRLTHNILRGIDYKRIKKKREENFEYLHYRLKDINKLELKTPKGPYMYPFYIDNGMSIKRKMVQKKIYIPSLWPNLFNEKGMAREFSENILPLPCDQRYSVEDMSAVVDNLLAFYNSSSQE